jgi:hypothetical protein
MSQVIVLFTAAVLVTNPSFLHIAGSKQEANATHVIQ